MQPSFTLRPSLRFSVPIRCTLCSAPELKGLFCCLSACLSVWLFIGLLACVFAFRISSVFNTVSLACIIIHRKNTSFVQHCAGPLDNCTLSSLAFEVLCSCAHNPFSPIQSLVSWSVLVKKLTSMIPAVFPPQLKIDGTQWKMWEILFKEQEKECHERH